MVCCMAAAKYVPIMCFAIFMSIKMCKLIPKKKQTSKQTDGYKFDIKAKHDYDIYQR